MKTKQKALIIGGSIAGKMAARVLSDFYEEVIIFDQDSEMDGPFPRKGTRQGEHLHALLLAGQNGLEQLFPGITENFYESGAVKINSTRDLAWFHYGVWKLRYDGGFSTTLQTRPHLEWHITNFIKEIPNIKVNYNYSVKSYLYLRDENRIHGVEIIDNSGAKHTVTGDLIVDASGASSFTMSWLKNNGIKVPEKRVNIGLTYVSRIYQLPESNTRDWQIKMVYANPTKEQTSGTLSRIEGNKYICTLNGYENVVENKYNIKDEQAFIDLAKSLPNLDIYKELKDAKPLSKTSVYRIPHIVWRRFDKINNLPNGLLGIGDTVCRIDPAFGQGMTLAILEALTLQTLLQEKHTPLERAFHKKAAKIINPIWDMVTTEDFRYPSTSGTKPLAVKLRQWYTKYIFLLSAEDKEIYHDFVKVMNLLDPVTILFHPKVVWKVLKKSLSRK